jgi:hypothetical protein
VYDITAIQKDLGEHVTSIILFVHALFGCDTTSKLFSVGKTEALKMLLDEEFRHQASVYDSEQLERCHYSCQ